jgi:hypothetical protein
VNGTQNDHSYDVNRKKIIFAIHIRGLTGNQTTVLLWCISTEQYKEIMKLKLKVIGLALLIASSLILENKHANAITVPVNCAQLRLSCLASGAPAAECEEFFQECVDGKLP